MRETLVLCGDAPAPRRPVRTIRLSTSGASRNVALHSEDIGRRMLASVSGLTADLLDVATYVCCADQLVSRGGATARGLGADWRRDLRFVIPVREPDRWRTADVGESLERLLATMSDDNMHFEFVPSPTPAPAGGYLDFDARSDDVVLFSGGLDSLAGAVDHLARSTGRVLLVSHQSSTKIAARQRELATELSERFPNRVIHVPVRVTIKGQEAVETTQRTRSLPITMSNPSRN